MVNLKEEQKNAIYYEGKDLAVSASAGSGKTFVMISRIIDLITNKKAKLDEILALSFTESSALDMKLKLKKAIIESDILEEYKNELLLNIPVSDITTIDAFCLRLCKTYFYYLSIPSDFKILDNEKKSAFKNSALDKTLKEFFDNENTDFISLSDKMAKKRKDDELKKIILSIYDFIDTEVDRGKALNKCLYYYTKEGNDKVLILLKELLTEKLSKIKEGLLNAKKLQFLKIIWKIKILTKISRHYLKLLKTERKT